MTSNAREAAALLWHHRQAGTTLSALPDPLLPRTVDDGHAIQAEWPSASGQALAGWKIAATSAAGEAHINVKGPLPGRILTPFVHALGEAVSLAGNRMRVVEPEFAFRLGTNLAPRATPRTVAEVLAAVTSLHPAFEIPDSRYADFTQAGEAQLLADNACCGDFVFGAAAPDDWRSADLGSALVLAEVSDAAGSVRYTREGNGRSALGEPCAALAWLVNELSARDITLKAGQFVSTGTCTVPLEVGPGDIVRADYGPFGRMELRLVA